MEPDGSVPISQEPEVISDVREPPSSRIKGELVDRLLEKIAKLESQLREKEESKEQLIKAFILSPRARSPQGDGAGGAAPAMQPGRSNTSPIPHAPNKDLLHSLGDMDRHQPPTMSALGSSSSDWFSSVSSWVRQRTSPANGTVVARPSALLGMDAYVQVTAASAAEGGACSSTGPRAGGEGPSEPNSRRTTNTAGTAGGAGGGSGLAGGGGGTSTASSTWSALRHYSRYVTAEHEPDPIDEETRHQAMGEALAEANERLLEKELARHRLEAECRGLQQRLQAAEAAAADLEHLKEENLEAWRSKYELDAKLASTTAHVEGLQRDKDSLAQDLEALRQQMGIWRDQSANASDKCEREGQLLREQLEQRGAELAAMRGHMTQLEAERDLALQERQQAQEERAKVAEERDRAVAAVAQVSALQAAAAEAQAAAAAAHAAAADWQDKFLKERTVRRKLHEQLQVVRGNIRVMARVRPPLPSSRSVVAFPLEGLLSLQDPNSGRQREFEFDAAFGPDAGQERVFEEALPLVRSCADGYNVCIFAYGQTGSGKTYTMQGPPEMPGINARALQELFRIAAEEPDRQWCFSVAVMEIYNEAVHDLLALSAAAGGGGAGSGGGAEGAPPAKPPSAELLAKYTLDVSALGAGELPPNMDRVQGLVWRPVSTPEQVQDALREGSRARRTASTALNAASSRSHALVSVKVRALQDGRPATTLMHLVDLAGSERIERSEVVGEQLKEAQAINKSLSALGDVISSLQRRTSHIPFRNSKLTQVLQDSLCGSSKVLLVCNLSPEAASAQETLSSLNFASRAAQVELGPAKKVAPERAAAQVQSGSEGGGGGGGSEVRSSGGGGGGSGESRANSPSGSPSRVPAGLRGATRFGDRGSPVPSAGGSPRLPSGAFAKPAKH